jgi:hypothetical protein
MKVILSLKDYYNYWNFEPSAKFEREWRSTVSAFKGHQALLGWYLNDELGPSDVGFNASDLPAQTPWTKTVDMLTTRNAAVKAADPAHVTNSIVNRWICSACYASGAWPRTDFMGVYANTSDIIGVDPYAWKNRTACMRWAASQTDCPNLETEVDYVDALMQAYGAGAAGRRGTMCASQIYDYGATSPEGVSLYSEPSFAVKRAMTWLLPVSGCGGILHYDWRAQFVQSENRTANTVLMANASTVARRLAEMARIGQELQPHLNLLATAEWRQLNASKFVHAAWFAPDHAASGPHTGWMFIVNSRGIARNVTVVAGLCSVSRTLEPWAVAKVDLRSECPDRTSSTRPSHKNDDTIGSQPDPTGVRAAALQQQIDAAISTGKPATVTISGTYNFSLRQHSDVRSLFCFAGSGNVSCSLGITLHFFNSSEMTAEDVWINAAPYMAVTSFNGEGGHILRRVEFEPNEPGQLFVSERDGVHESDVRRGISILQSRIFGQRDDFLNVRSTLLVVLRCAADKRSCLMVNPHVESGRPDSTYASNSLLEAARAGDQLSFVPMYTEANKPARLQRLARTVLSSAVKVTDPATAEAHALSRSMLTFGGHPLVTPAFRPDVWNVSMVSPVSADTPPSTKACERRQHPVFKAGAMIVDSVFNFSTGAMRFKSSNSIIRNNSVHNEGCRVNSHGSVVCATASLEVSYVQPWFEGAASIENATVEHNRWYLGAGVNPLKANPLDTSNIVQRNDQFLPKLKTDDQRSGSTNKRIDWYTERCGPEALGEAAAGCAAAVKFATVTHSWLVDGIMPCCNMLQIDCRTGLLQYDVSAYNFSRFAPFVAAGKAVSVALEGTGDMASCCASANNCTIRDHKEALAQQLLALALTYKLSSFTGDWEFNGQKLDFYWAGWNETMAHIASVLSPHGIGIGNSIASDANTLDACARPGYPGGPGAPDWCPAYRNVPWADVLTDMSTYGLDDGTGQGTDVPLPWSKNGTRGTCPYDSHNDPSIIQYCGGIESRVMNVLHSPVAKVYSDRPPQLSPGLYIGECLANPTTRTRQGWTRPKLSEFLSFLDTQGITRIGLWCTNISPTSNETDPIGFPCPLDGCPWMLEEIKAWKMRNATANGVMPAAVKTDDRPGDGSTVPFSTWWLLGERSWEPPPYDVSQYGFNENGTMILDVFGGQPVWPDIKGHDRGPDGLPCGGWPPRDEFSCLNFSYTNETCKGTHNWYRDHASHRTDLGPLCCNEGGCVPQEANVSAILAVVAQKVAQHVPVGFDGNCVLDQEGYSAIATDVQFGECDWPHAWSNIYRNYSTALVRARQPGLPAEEVARIAQEEWQNATVALMVASLETARRTRPACKWGYYGKEVSCSIYEPCAPSPAPGADPLCGYDHPVEGPKFRRQAEVLQPVVQASDILFPSVYMMSVAPRSHGYILLKSTLACDRGDDGLRWAGPHCSNNSIEVQRAGLRSVIGQALRSAAAVDLPSKPTVVPFIWNFCSICNSAHSNCAPCYQNSSLDLNASFHINRWGIEASLRIPYELGAAGVLVWVDQEENSETQQLESVLHGTTGPIGKQLLGEIAECSLANCSGHGRCQPLQSSSCECYAGFTGPRCAKATTVVVAPVKHDDVDGMTKQQDCGPSTRVPTHFQARKQPPNLGHHSASQNLAILGALDRHGHLPPQGQPRTLG